MVLVSHVIAASSRGAGVAGRAGDVHRKTTSAIVIVHTTRLPLLASPRSFPNKSRLHEAHVVMNVGVSHVGEKVVHANHAPRCQVASSDRSTPRCDAVECQTRQVTFDPDERAERSVWVPNASVPIGDACVAASCGLTPMELPRLARDPSRLA